MDQKEVILAQLDKIDDLTKQLEQDVRKSNKRLFVMDIITMGVVVVTWLLLQVQPFVYQLDDLVHILTSIVIVYLGLFYFSTFKKARNEDKQFDRWIEDTKVKHAFTRKSIQRILQEEARVN